MSLDPQSTQRPESPELQSIAAKMDALDAAVSSAVRSARTRNMLTLVFGIISVLLVGYWLNYAHKRFSKEVNPELVANLGQSYLEEYLPSAASQLEVSLKENAPNVINEGETRLRALPIRLDDQFRDAARKQIEARMPDLEERLYQSLKLGLADALKTMQKTPGEDESARFRNLADSLAALYRNDALKFADETYLQYTKGAGDIVNGLALLAEEKNLTQEQKTQRNLVRDFLILAHDSAPPEPRTLPDAK